MSAHYRCDYCGTDCQPGTGIASTSVSIAPGAVDKAWRRNHSEHRSSLVRLSIGLDGIKPEGERFGHDLCDECIAAHLRVLLARLEDQP